MNSTAFRAAFDHYRWGTDDISHTAEPEPPNLALAVAPAIKEVM